MRRIVKMFYHFWLSRTHKNEIGGDIKIYMSFFWYDFQHLFFLLSLISDFFDDSIFFKRQRRRGSLEVFYVFWIKSNFMTDWLHKLISLRYHTHNFPSSTTLVVEFGLFLGSSRRRELLIDSIRLKTTRTTPPLSNNFLSPESVKWVDI